MNTGKGKYRERFGQVEEKVLLLLFAGVVLAFTTRPDHSLRILRSTVQAWRKINQRSLRGAVKRLHRAKFIDFRQQKDGVVVLSLSKSGARQALRCDVSRIVIPKPARWDGLWRMVLFDIPESLKKGRDALASKLKRLGFYQLQKSVFLYPYPCKHEIDVVAEAFNAQLYIHFVTIKDLDNDNAMRRKFGLR